MINWRVGCDKCAFFYFRNKKNPVSKCHETIKIRHGSVCAGRLGLIKCALFDIDDTLSIISEDRRKLLESRADVNWDRFYDMSFNDDPNMDMIQLCEVCSQSYNIIFITSRSECVRGKTENWLSKYFDFPINLLMRPDGNVQSPVALKKSLLLGHGIEPRLIAFAVDDDREIVDMYRNEDGVTAFHYTGREK